MSTFSIFGIIVIVLFPIFMGIHKIRKQRKAVKLTNDMVRSWIDQPEKMLELGGQKERPDELPAWGMFFQSPFSVTSSSNSWLGGLPSAPSSFKWPNDRNGLPRHFLAQIDLSALNAEGIAELPQSGTMLIFFDQYIQNDQLYYDYSCHVFTDTEMSNAIEMKCPSNLSHLSELGFFHDSPVFRKWSVELVPFTSKGELYPAVFTKITDSPASWIKNWAIAVLDAELVIESLKREVEPYGDNFEERQKRLLASFKDNPNNKVIKSKIDHYNLMKDRVPDLLNALNKWKDFASSSAPNDPVDDEWLDEIFKLRNSLKNEMQNYSPKFLLGGNPKEVWNRLCAKFPKFANGTDFFELPSEYRPFAELQITGWRGHRLFGLEPPFPNNWEDLRGHDCLISITADQLLGTQSEHEYGMSIWCLSEEMSKGKFENGQVVRHCAV